MKTFTIRIIFLFFLLPFSFIANAAWVDSKESNGIVYFLDNAPAAIKRYSLQTESFLTSIPLSTGTPTAFFVDAAGIYVSYGQATYRYDLDGTNETHLENMNNAVSDLSTLSDTLIIVAGGDVKSVNKNTAALLGTTTAYGLRGLSVSQSLGKAFVRDSGLSPSDIRAFTVAANGSLGNVIDSPYHGSYPFASKTYMFPDDARVIDNAGIVYNAMDLTYNNSVAGAFNDIAFWNELPIILRNDTLYSYDQSLTESGTFTLPVTASRIFIANDTVYAFYEDVTNEIVLTTAVISSFSTATPGAPVDPVGLAYTPDDIILGNDNDTVYLLSRTHLSIFRWSISSQSYLSSIPLAQAPSYMAYSAETNRIYLAYSSGKLSQVQLDISFNELDFVTLPETPSALATAGKYVFTVYLANYSRSQYTFAPDGALVSNTGYAYSSNQFEWNAANSRMYYIRSNVSPSDIHWREIDKTTGILGQDMDSPYHSSAGMQAPVRVAPDGSLVILGSGRIYDGTTLTQLDTLSTPTVIADTAWANTNVFTLRPFNSTTTVLEHWTAMYGVHDAINFGGLPMRVFGWDHQMLIITSVAGVPTFNFHTPVVIDSDGDSYVDPDDAFPADSTEWIDNDNDGIGNNADTDDDNDGVLDVNDAFPLDPTESVDTDGDGTGNNADTDDDNDGVIDVNDAFPLDPTESVDTDGDGTGNNADTDDDNDGVLDVNDAFPLDSTESVDTDSDGTGNNTDTDDDNDGVLDTSDAFPLDPTESVDTDGDGIGNNADTDDDNDGVLDASDAFPLDPTESVDTDGDGVGNNADAFPTDATETTDTDGDGVGDNADAFPNDATETMDSDGDGIGNNTDTDNDNDGVLDVNDAFPLDPNETMDTDGDGVGDNADAFPTDATETLDTDGDGVGDNADLYPNDPSRTQLSIGDYLPLNAGSSWTYTNSNTPAVLDSQINITGRNIKPMHLPSGARFYFDATTNEINLYGYYLPAVATQFGNFSADVKFNSAVRLLQENMTNGQMIYHNGSGSVNIQPTYGVNGLSYNGSTRYVGLESVTVPYGTVDAHHITLSITTTSNVQGASVGIVLDMDLWFAKDVGIVQYRLPGETARLVNASIAAASTSQPSSSGGSGGGGGCTLNREAKFDPLFPLMVLIGFIYLWRRREQGSHEV